MRFTRNFQGSLHVLCPLVVLLLCMVGCSENPLGTADQPTEPRVLGRTASSSAAMFSSAEFRAEAMISANEGGQLSLVDVTLDIPAGAVDSDTLFFIEIPDISVFYNEFGTYGLAFNVPVKVTMSYRDADLSGIEEETIRIGWFSEGAGTYLDVDCVVDFDTKSVTGYLDHFSAYALISD